MKKILIPIIAAFALVAPQSASADTTALAAAPYCDNGSVFPVGVGVRCYYGGRTCIVYASVDLEIIDGPRQTVCI